MAIKTFTTGEVLTAADTNTYLANSGLVYVTGAAFTAQSSVPVSGVFTTGANNYRIIVRINAVNSNATRTINMRFRDSGGDDGGPVYTYASQMSGLTQTTFNANNGGYGQTEFKLCNAYYAGEFAAATLDILDPFSASKVTSASGMVQGGTASENTTGTFGGFATAKSYTGFSLYPSTGNITGTYYVYAYRNA